MSKDLNLIENLQALCEQSRTVSELCRKVGINRQQFNKYLAGTHQPSKSNLRALAHHFGLSEDFLFSNPSDFRSMLEGDYFHLFRSLIKSPKMLLFINELMSASGGESTDALAGIYERYQYSSIYPGHILRSIYCLYKKDGLLMHYYIERFPSMEGTGRVDYLFKYHGLSFLLAGRLFSIDFETIQHNEITFSNLALVSRNSMKYIFGVTSGVAATMMRQPIAAKVAMNFIDKGLVRKSHLKRATVLLPDDPTIPKEVCRYLNSGANIINSAS